MTWDEIEFQIDRYEFTDEEPAELWECLYLTRSQMQEVLNYVQQNARCIFLYPFPEPVQQQVASGQLAPRKTYEISKLGNDEAKSRLAEEAAEKALSTEQTKRAVSKRAGKKKPKPRSTKESIRTPEGWTVTVSSRKKGSYHEVEQALEYALDEIRHRIKNGIQAI